METSLIVLILVAPRVMVARLLIYILLKRSGRKK